MRSMVTGQRGRRKHWENAICHYNQRASRLTADAQWPFNSTRGPLALRLLF